MALNRDTARMLRNKRSLVLPDNMKNLTFLSNIKKLIILQKHCDPALRSYGLADEYLVKGVGSNGLITDPDTCVTL